MNDIVSGVYCNVKNTLMTESPVFNSSRVSAVRRRWCRRNIEITHFFHTLHDVYCEDFGIHHLFVLLVAHSGSIDPCNSNENDMLTAWRIWDGRTTGILTLW